MLPLRRFSVKLSEQSRWLECGNKNIESIYEYGSRAFLATECLLEGHSSRSVAMALESVNSEAVA